MRAESSQIILESEKERKSERGIGEKEGKPQSENSTSSKGIFQRGALAKDTPFISKCPKTTHSCRLPQVGNYSLSKVEMRKQDVVVQHTCVRETTTRVNNTV